MPPLETEENEAGVRKSDHNIVLTRASLPRLDAPVWQKFEVRSYSEKGAASFKEWLDSRDWDRVLLAQGSNEKSRQFQLVLDEGMDLFFPLKVVRRKENDKPWIDNESRKRIAKKKAVYKAEGKSGRFKAIELSLAKYLEKRRQRYLNKQRGEIASPDKIKKIFKTVSAYKTAEKPKAFDIRELRPGVKDKELANEVAGYFNRISDEFSPLDPFEIPSTYNRQLPLLGELEVEKKLLECKKPRSMVEGDIFPKLVSLCARSLSVPLASIFNTITETMVWPIAWKREIVTIIPKKSIPSSFADLRNISCTRLFSKVYESYVLMWALEEIELKNNQFGGQKGCSTAHVLLTIWNEIAENCEDYRSGTVLTAIDYAKAFNRLSFQHCLKAFKKKGSSTQIIRLLSTFLTNRTMSVKVGNSRSDPLPVNGGCPQGSILGVLLYNVTTDDLEDDYLGLTKPDSPKSYDDPPVPVDPPRTSTPSKIGQPDCRLSPLGGGRFQVKDMEIVFEKGAVNVPPIEYSDEGLITRPKEIKIGTQVLVEKPVKIVKYIDNNVVIEKLNYGRMPMQLVAGKMIKKRRALPTQNAFRSINKNAGKKGMMVNSLKTQMLVVSDALNYTPFAFIEDRNGQEIASGDELKVLGFTFGPRPTVHKHVELTLKKIRRKYWALRHLKKLGFNQEELVKIYKSLLLPIADYCDVVYHSLLTDEQDQALERAQVGALRVIFDYKSSGRELREKAQLQTLRNRRVSHCDKFALKAANSDRFGHWFAKNPTDRNQRVRETYTEHYARCDRLKNSPLFFMRRRLNGKEGLKYWERNREFRDN